MVTYQQVPPTSGKRFDPLDVNDETGDVFVVTYEEFQTKTGGRLDALDITDEVGDVVRSSGVSHGSALVFSPHTTCAILIARPGKQMLAALERVMRTVAPEDGYYMHDDLTVRTENLVEDEPANGPAHIVHVFVGKASETVPVIDSRLALGRDQRVMLVELDASRSRRYCVQVIGR